MAPLLLREMKGKTFSCSSPASLATCSTIHHKSTIQPLTRMEIDRHTPRLRDPQRIHFDRSNSSSKPRARHSSDSKAARRKSSADVDSSKYLLKSSRFRLDDSYYDIFPENPVQIPSFLAIEKPRSERIGGNQGAVLRPSSSTRTQDQVVVLRVSLHCKGCEGKVRRHIAKMQGVRSFSVDLATKKVTVVGDVTPLSVLNSISKVKHAQFWQSPPRASASF
ncbi:protein SODIUM POTASSIUM ROOT DEFECTIVE 2-like [Curcuma longa]|uniref:protein SODIUM POTASSIUM ROOT DEFECTIVE 2-like n=1 Tax=Curcuma longa TaxID=136217 RepID=UPI003D9F2D2D